ncbi:MAG: DUF5009 domain-containing protein [Kiritimatiellae bacterium]|nr:DUF5009 domain-containing protein [Kiritimatiellia bacterium]
MEVKTDAGRLFSLDFLRGLDMFLLVAIGPLMRGADKAWGLSPSIMAQFRHGWEGFTLWDIIMPMFIFMCGAAIPLALTKRMKDGHPTGAFWRHVAWRFVLLWFLGMMAQGRILTLDPMQISPYNNTLQTIAAGYLITALLMLTRNRIVQIVVPVLLFAAYGILLACFGDYTETGNCAYQVEMSVLRWIVPPGSKAFQIGGYTWFLTTMMFAFMSLCGYHCTEILRSGCTPCRKMVMLLALGGGLLGLGWLLSIWVPVIKPIFTVSFTAQAMGWCVLAWALLYLITDMYQLRRGLGVFILYGKFALTAYLCHTVFHSATDRVAQTLAQGLPRIFGAAAQPFTLACVMVLVITWLVWIRSRLRPLGIEREKGNRE